ncbi:GbsR/MarR family transcriptional regulator [Pararhodobacter oceanensis]|uniref:GbsR/MarR family transcriptional regulator n=1 Tax=Pararhodobacter oceanensis TaxID=2172121 RepID=UPI003A95A27A
MDSTAKPKSAAQARADFIEKTGVIVQSEGLPRIAGRVLALLLYDGERVSFGQLAEALQVSRGSISSSVRLLETQQLIKRVAEPGDRQDYFQIAPSAFPNLIEASVLRMRRAAADIEETLAEIPETEAGPRQRVAEFVRYYHAMTEAMTETAQHLRRRP